MTGRLPIYFVAFAASGFAGLIYESIWTHYLKLFLGHAAYAQTLVLAIFMGGMAAGAWMCSRWSRFSGNLLLAYAIVEAIIGVMALLFHPFFVRVTDFALGAILPGLPESGWATPVMWSLGTLLILPQSILLGMTFPLMATGLLRRFPENQGATLATLYFVNSLGGGIGVLVSGFLLLGWLGLPGTIALAGATNILLALIVASICGRDQEPSLLVATAAANSVDLQPGGRRGASLSLLLAVAGLTGLSSFIYEVGWIRMLSLVLGSSTHSFELMLSAFILGLALGGWWIRRRIDGILSPRSYLGWIQVIMGLCALATLPLYDFSFHAMNWLMGAVSKTTQGYLHYNIASHGIALMVMLPAAFCAGMTLPLITHALLRANNGESAIGLVYGANTVGAIAGVLLAVHWGLPVLGLKYLVIAGALIDIALGAVLLAPFSSFDWRMRVAGITAGATALILGLGVARFDQHQMASGVFRAGQKLLAPNQATMMFYRDGKTATISVLDTPGQVRQIRTNGKADASIYMGQEARVQLDEVTMVLVGALPLLLKPDARIAANIGMGSGLSSHVMLAQPQLERVDTIEIEAQMVVGARLFQPRNQRAFESPRSNIVIEDAKTFFSSRTALYDVIVSEPSNPWVSGVSSLFSREFHAKVKRHLKPDGVMLQWLQLYEIDEASIFSVLKSIDENFSDYAIYAANFGDIVVVATPQGQLPELPSEFPPSPLAAELSRVGIASPADIGARRIGGKRGLAPLLRAHPIPVNSDYFPVLDQNANLARFLGKNAQHLPGLLFEPLPIWQLLDPSSEQSFRRISRHRVAANDHLGMPLPRAFAEFVLDWMTTGNAPAATGPLSNGFMPRAEMLLANCRTPPQGDRVYAALQFGVTVLPFLDPAEALRLWPHIAKLPCVADLGERERDWADLMQAVARQDGSAMAAISTTLLDRKQAGTAAREKYLLATAMLGLIATGRKPDALELLARHRATLYPAALPLSVRLLEAHAGQ